MMILHNFIYKVFGVLVALLLIEPINGRANYSRQDDERQRAIAMFHEGRFAEALPLLIKLKGNYPYDELLKYMAGASMVETAKYGQEAEKLLAEASEREVPDKVFYYLARNYHAMESYNNAQRFYNRFKNLATDETVKLLNIEELSALCYRQVNPFAGANADNEDTTDTTVIAMPEQDVSTAPEAKVQPENTNEEAPAKIDTTGEKEFILFQVSPTVTYLITDMFQVDEARENFLRAREKERVLEASLKELNSLRGEYARVTHPLVRDSLTQKILGLEYETLVMRADADRLYAQAKEKEQEWWADADFSAFEAYEKVVASVKQRQAEAEKRNLETKKPGDDTVLTDSAIIRLVVPIDEQPTAPVSSDPGVVYKVQLGAFSRGIPAYLKPVFDRISKIRPVETYINDAGATVYTTGNLKTQEDATKLQNQVRLEGIKDAFVIAMKDGKRISLPEAKKITGEP